MKKKRVNCQECEHFVHLEMEGGSMTGHISRKARCKLGKRVMFRKPVFLHNCYVPINDYGYIRLCDKFKYFNPTII